MNTMARHDVHFAPSPLMAFRFIQYVHGSASVWTLDSVSVSLNRAFLFFFFFFFLCLFSFVLFTLDVFFLQRVSGWDAI